MKRGLPFPPVELKPNSSVFGMKIALWAVLLVWALEAALSASWFWSATGTVLLGLMFAHGVELQHQALHNSGFRSRRLNEFAGVVLGIPMLVSFAGYQASHLRHHKYLGTDKNREFFDYGDQYGQGGLSAAWHAILRFSMLSHYRTFACGVARAIAGRSYPGETQYVSRRMRRDHLLMLAGILALGVASYLMSEQLLIRGWLIPLTVVAAPVHALIELPEHFRCETDSTDTFRNTRTIRSNAFLTWFTNGNNLHVEHHLLPRLPIEELTELHRRVAPQIKYLCPTYIAFFLDILGWKRISSEPAKISSEPANVNEHAEPRTTLILS